MSFEVIERVTQIEREGQERRAAAEAEARNIVSEAKREGLACVQQVRDAAAEQGKKLLQAAEARAEGRTAEIRKEAETNADALRTTAAGRLEEAAELIVGRVVKQ